MNWGTSLLGRSAIVLLLLALAGMGWSALGTEQSPGRLIIGRREEALSRKLRFLRAPITAKRVMLAQTGFVAVCVLAAALAQQPLLLAGAALALAVPDLYIDHLVAARTAQVESQIESWLNAVANSLRASPSLGEAIASSIALVPSPMAQEVDVLVKEYELGVPLDRALDNLAARIASKTLAGTTLALKVARRSGGNLPAMLESAALALRELARLEGVVRTKTAEGKAQAVVIGAIPVPLIGVVQYSDPHFFEPLVSTFTGNLVIGGAVALWVLAVLMARKILQVDV